MGVKHWRGVMLTVKQARNLALPPQWFQKPYLVGNEPMSRYAGRIGRRAPPLRQCGTYLGVAQLVAHMPWEHGVGSSNLPAQTMPFRVSGREEANKHGEKTAIVHRGAASLPAIVGYHVRLDSQRSMTA